MYYKKTATLALGIGMALTLSACGNGGDGGGPTADPRDAGIDETTLSAAARTVALAVGDADCPAGGVLVETGIDENANGVLDDNEVDEAEKVCHGSSGADGAAGPAGATGATGPAGANGATGPAGAAGVDGANALVEVNPEPVGINCYNGGLRIDVGIDSNHNGVLDLNNGVSETIRTAFVCHGGDNAKLAWQVAELIEFENAGNAGSPQVKVDGSGNAIAVWSQQRDGTSWDIWSNRYAAGIGWGEPELLEIGDAGSAHSPVVAVNSDGNAVAVWYQWERTHSNIWSNRYEVGVGWQGAELIESDDAGDANIPHVALDDNGNAVAVWRQWDGASWDIWANRYDEVSGWGDARRIESNAGPVDEPLVVMDASGNAVVAWSQHDGTDWSLLTNRYDAGTGKWGDDAEELESNDSGAAVEARLAVDGIGNVMAVWRQEDNSLTDIWANYYVAGSGWNGPDRIESDNSGSATNPQIALDANGNALAVWQQFDGANENILANRYLVGTGWVGAELIIEGVEMSTGSLDPNHQVAAGSDGSAVVVWAQGDGMRNNIWAKRYVTGSGWGDAEVIETRNVGGASAPQVAIDANGNAVAVWEQYDGMRYNIWANRYVALPAP